MSDIYLVNPGSTHNYIEIVSQIGSCLNIHSSVPQDQDVPDFDGMFDPCEGACVSTGSGSGGSGIPDGDYVVIG